MNRARTTAQLLAGLVAAIALVAAGCAYIVPPPAEHTSPTPALSQEGWTGVVTGVSETGGALHVDLAIVNTSGDWSAMDVAASKARVLDASGKATECSKVFVGTSVFVNNGGQFLPPGFAMKGYTGGSAAAPEPQPLYAECAGVSKANASKLQVDYTYITGPFDYYKPSHTFGKTMSLDLAKPVSDQAYPIGNKVDGLIEKQDAVITGVNDFTVQLVGVRRTLIKEKPTDDNPTIPALEFSWKSTNPSDYDTYAPHIGFPPVIGSDGILYGFYVSPHRPDTPMTPSKGEATWTTTVAVPKDATGLYILLPVETKQQSYFVDHVVDITAE